MPSSWETAMTTSSCKNRNLTTLGVCVTLLSAFSHIASANEPVSQVMLRAGDGSSVVAVVPQSPRAETLPDLHDDPPTASTRGEDWQRMTVPAGLYLRAISMASPQIGYCAGEL